MSNRDSKLKPCPFCGSNNVELRSGFMFNGAVHCNNCTADVVFDAVGLVTTGNDNWQKVCTDGWNKRAGEVPE